MTNKEELLTTVAEDLSFAAEAGSAFGYVRDVLRDEEDRPYIEVISYDDDGEVGDRYRMYVEFIREEELG